MRQLPFYAWMHTGMQVFSMLDSLGYRSFVEYLQPPVWMEVFPSASARLMGKHPPKGNKHQQRLYLLEQMGIEIDLLSNRHLVDAAICAVTGIHGLKGRFAAIGDRQTGFIILPAAPGAL
jgi:predicted RNase H-like nuclease